MSFKEGFDPSMADAKEFQAAKSVGGAKAFLCTPQPCAKPCGAPCQHPPCRPCGSPIPCKPQPPCKPGRSR